MSASTSARSSTRLEVAIGWSLAACVHPAMAWRVLSRPRCYLVAAAYGIGAYLAVLAALFILR